MRLRSIAVLSAAVGALAAGLVAVAQPPAETRDPNKQGYKPAFAGQTRAPNMTTDTKFEIKEVAKGIVSPFGVEFLPNGKFIVTERLAGQFRIIDKDGKVSEPIKNGVPEVAARGQGGLLDVVLDPNYATNQIIYWSYSEPQTDGTNNTAVAKGKLVDGAQPKIENIQVIYHQKPAMASPLHFGSRLVFAKDGTLFVTQGERSILPGRVQAQDLKSGLGKIVRINTDGSIPKDNPYVGNKDGALPEIWSYGHRNMQGAALNPATGALWTSEHGPRGGDEINVPQPGRNYGWPVVSYGVNYDGTPVGTGQQKAPGMEDPIHQWTPVIAASGMAFYTADAVPGWKGNLFSGGLVCRCVVRLELDGTRVTREERLFGELGQRIRDVRQGPDGALYLLTDEDRGELLRVVPAGRG